MTITKVPLDETVDYDFAFFDDHENPSVEAVNVKDKAFERAAEAYAMTWIGEERHIATPGETSGWIHFWTRKAVKTSWLKGQE